MERKKRHFGTFGDGLCGRGDYACPKLNLPVLSLSAHSKNASPLKYEASICRDLPIFDAGLTENKNCGIVETGFSRPTP